MSRRNASSRFGFGTRSRMLRVELMEVRRLLTLTPELLVAVPPGFSHLTESNGTLFFVAEDTIAGPELWKTDGTASGTTMVKDIQPGKYCYSNYFHEPESCGGPRYLTSANGTLYFGYFDDIHGTELWESDGTETGTVLVEDIYPGPYHVTYDDYHEHVVSRSGSSDPHSLTEFRGGLYFSAASNFSGRELWKVDQATDGAARIQDINPGISDSNPSALLSIQDKIYFTADDGRSGSELWSTDGTTFGTVRVKDIWAAEMLVYDDDTLLCWGEPGSSRPNELTAVGNTLYFVADNGMAGTELWKSDGIDVGTILVKDIRPGTVIDNSPCGYYYGQYFGVGSNPRLLTSVGNTLFFVADDGVNGVELWKSDGTAAGTLPVKDIRAGSNSSDPQYLTSVNGALLFLAGDAVSGVELWTSDGTEAGTVRVKDIRAGSSSSNSRFLTNVNGMLFFTANDGEHGLELWVSDGTEAGTLLVADIREGVAGSEPSGLTAVGNALYFTADDGVHGSALWKVVVEDEATPGDTNGDGNVNIEDLNNVRNHFGETGDGVLGDTAPFDGKVDIQDLNAVRNNFGAGGGGGDSALRTGRSHIATENTADEYAPSEALRANSPYHAIAAQAADVLFGLHSNDASLTPPWKSHSRRQLVR